MKECYRQDFQFRTSLHAQVYTVCQKLYNLEHKDSYLASTYRCPIQELSLSDLIAEEAAHGPC